MPCAAQRQRARVPQLPPLRGRGAGPRWGGGWGRRRGAMLPGHPCHRRRASRVGARPPLCPPRSPTSHPTSARRGASMKRMGTAACGPPSPTPQPWTWCRPTAGGAARVRCCCRRGAAALPSAAQLPRCPGPRLAVWLLLAAACGGSRGAGGCFPTLPLPRGPSADMPACHSSLPPNCPQLRRTRGRGGACLARRATSGIVRWAPPSQALRRPRRRRGDASTVAVAGCRSWAGSAAAVTVKDGCSMQRAVL